MDVSAMMRSFRIPGFNCMCRSAAPRRSTSGFSLIEMMVAMVLGLLLSAGIVTLFAATGKTNKVQDALARLQENGRYAITRLNYDLRMAGGQYCSNVGSLGWTSSVNNGPQYPGISVIANVAGVSTGTLGSFPDSGGTAGIPPAGWPAGTTYPIGPAALVRGYDCLDGGACTPAVPAGGAPDGLPAAGTADGARVRGADVLTIRYQSGTGWPFVLDATTPPNLVLQPSVVGADVVDDPVNFASGDRALLLTCGGGQVFGVNAAGNTLTPIGLLDVSKYKPNPINAGYDVRVFNFTRDFVTVTYYLLYKADPERPGRLIPTLYRRLNGSATPDELVQGVERLDFLYGVQTKDATLHYWTAAEVNANSTAALCSPPPAELGLAPNTVEAGCLWRSVKSVQANLLLDTVHNIDLSLADMGYRWTARGNNNMQLPPDDQNADMGNGMRAGRMMRREFISLVATRNGNH